ncbi:DUF202 domain-containing protein [Arthrobacter sp. M4]|uniref:DUF202 domain-containing protein n=1 Tax=Arthrobacter sp. M4 TaxID=218160 RepID=UPI001CDC333C|nr:DUF202 domain-containing protein [Arthrobacter sp. M4]MCA4132140.1 DUF202 domain-containing protein [Arthrobacter sp. M4]
MSGASGDAPGVPDARDPGLQRERTTLAWRRTLISLLVVDLFIWRAWLASKSAPMQGGPSQLGIDYQGICALAAAAATVVLAVAAWQRAHQLHYGTNAPSSAVVLSCTAAVVLLGASAVAAISLGG